MACILFVDDDTLTLTLLGKAAQLLGHTPLTCTSGAEGLALLTSARPDLVLVDLNLADMDGLEFIRQARSAPNGSCPPVILHTAGRGPDDEQRAIEAGAQGCLPKPASLDALADLIARYTTQPA
ncbi:MAG TPA: response regulator [Chloroflexi bacterium]|nr:response regulator [Chloroflexota bacterium]HPO57485.1 response regulator [Anaerolineaceae bacterium]